MRRHPSTVRRFTIAAAVASLASTGLAAGLTAAPPAAAAVAAPRAVTTVVPGSINRSSRSAVLAAYKTRYVTPSRVVDAWTGSVSGCAAGGNSSAYTRATLTAINWARGQAGIPPVVGLNSTYSSQAQRTALLMQAQGALSHAPSRSWRCWSAAGAAGAARSNLTLGLAGARAVSMYLTEPGSGNTAAGHRRWVLYPRLGPIGIGNTRTANALYVLGARAARVPAGTPAYYGWPTSGYFPRAAEPRGRWSLSSSRGYSFARATVRVVGPNGAPIRVVRYAAQTGFGDNTLVWQLATVPSRTARVDQRYRVTVSGIRTPTGAVTAYSYAVIARLLTERAASPQGTATPGQPSSGSIDWRGSGTSPSSERTSAAR